MPVYFIQDEGGAIKIGYSDGNPHRRLNTFRTGNPRELKLLVSIPGGAPEEKALHERFADLRIRGEWFQADTRLLGFIDGLAYQYRDQQPKPLGDSAALADVFDDEQLEALFHYISTRLNAERAQDVVNDGSNHGLPFGQLVRITNALFYDAQSAEETPGPIGDGARAALARYDVKSLLKTLSELENEHEAGLN